MLHYLLYKTSRQVPTLFRIKVQWCLDPVKRLLHLMDVYDQLIGEMSLWVHAIGMPAPVGVHLNPNSFFIRISVTRWQDHFQSLAITTMNICRSLIIKIAKVGRKCCQILTNPKNIAKYFLCFAKLAKFRQLWSH